MCYCLEDKPTPGEEVIVETHNTREVGEVVKDYLERFPEFPQDLLNCTLNQEALDELNRARLRGANWLRTTLHHQLQKARHDWLREEIVKLEGMKVAATDPKDFTYIQDYNRALAWDKSHNNALQTIIDRYQSELDQPTSDNK